MSSLRNLYPAPATLALAKQQNCIDAHGKHFIGLSPFLVMATANADGRCDASPRGDAPGFVVVSDPVTLLIPDRPGNNRLDSLANLGTNPGIGLIFFVPGVLETYRVNGRAALTVEAELLAGMEAGGRLPRSALRVTVEEAFFHCGKALKRSSLWEPSSHVEPGRVASLGRILAEQTGRIGVAEAEARVEVGYRDHLY